MQSTSDLNIPAHWDDAIGVITNLYDATGEDVDDLELAEAAVWLCYEGAYAGQHFVISDISELRLATVH